MRMQKKFGMFIHWGIYSIPAYHEQIKWRYFTPRNVYRTLMDRFNPTEYNPSEWVKLAKDCGMEYICFTTKHHDGFCMWDTKHTDFNIMNTPYGKDVLKELADACAREGIALSLYYSNPDWDHEYGYNPASSHQCPMPGDKVDTLKYREYQKAQIKELLTNYGKIYTFFWDIPTKVEDKSMNEFVRSLQPDILINDRGWGDSGDFTTPERTVPDGTAFDHMTEACQSVGYQTWGYCTHEDYYTTAFLTASIDKIRSMGGSYLLNIGPTASGKLPGRAVDIVTRVGDWYKRVSEAFDAEPCSLLENTNLFTTRRGSTLYVHLPTNLNVCGLVLRPIHILPKSVTLLNDGRPLRYSLRTQPEDRYLKGTKMFLKRPALHVADLPVEEFSREAMILKIELDEGKIEI